MADEKALCAFVHRKIARLDEDTSWARGMCAKLRRGIGKPPGALAALWEVTLADALPEWDGRNGDPSYEQHAVHAALTLYALHRQGKEHSMNRDGGDSLGAATARLIDPDRSNFDAIKRRFDVIVTSSEFLELAYHARSVVQLLKAADVLLDYPRLAADLYAYQHANRAAGVRLRWGQDFYRVLPKTKDGKEEEAE